VPIARAAPKARRHTVVEAPTLLVGGGREFAARFVAHHPPGNTSSTIEATINLHARSLEPFDANRAKY
jgi:hypothetical protein